jgi:integrase
MPRAKRAAPLYQRGPYSLDWDRKSDGTLRTPFLTVFWYDGDRGRVRSRSTSETELEAGKVWLDAFYLERTTGKAVCFHCGQFKRQAGSYPLTAAIADYLEGTVPGKPSEDAIRARLDHVLDFVEQDDVNVSCDQVDEFWIGRFRAWSQRQPVVSTAGKILRERSLATVEASVAQLSAAINDSKRRKNVTHGANFRAQNLRDLNQTPEHRSDVAELASMFRYCVAPSANDDEERSRRIRERASLHRYLIISAATVARPDAAHDVSTDPRRGQWLSTARVLRLNPKGRRQTRKYRSTVRVAWQAALWLDNRHSDWEARCEAAKRERKPAPAAFFVGPKSIRKAWENMADELGLPIDGEAGTKLIRRSMAKLLRDRGVDREEVEMMLGHRRMDSTTEIYAPFDPAYLAGAVTAIETIIDEIEALTPGAFALPGGKVVTIGRKA